MPLRAEVRLPGRALMALTTIYVVGHVSRTWYVDMLELHEVMQILGQHHGCCEFIHCGTYPFDMNLVRALGPLVAHTSMDGPPGGPRFIADYERIPRRLLDADAVLALPQEGAAAHTADPNVVTLAEDLGVPVIVHRRGGHTNILGTSLTLPQWRPSIQAP